MALKEEWRTSGDWLYRRRSYLPLVLLVPLFLEVRNREWPTPNLSLQPYWEWFCLAVSFSGLAVRGLTVGHVPARTSSRHTLRQRVAALNTTGMYSIVRHPLYVGNFLSWLGIALFAADWKLLVVFVLAYWLYYERIMFAEEEYLHHRFGSDYEKWAAHTPAFLPHLSLWTKPALPFSLKTVLRREYSGLFAVTTIFALLDLVSDWKGQAIPAPQQFNLVLACAGAAIYLALRWLKKRTRLLHVSGR